MHIGAILLVFLLVLLILGPRAIVRVFLSLLTLLAILLISLALIWLIASFNPKDSHPNVSPSGEVQR
jgi:amino acid transporter